MSDDAHATGAAGSTGIMASAWFAGVAALVALALVTGGLAVVKVGVLYRLIARRAKPLPGFP